MFKIRVILFLLMVTCIKAQVSDAFAGIKCGLDIPRLLVGKRDSNERVVVLEQRYTILGLKNVGGMEISDRLFLESWKICGAEYELLVNTRSGLVRDVLPFPPHSAKSSQLIGTYQVAGKEIPETILALLDNRAGHNARDQEGAKVRLKATAAWKLDGIKEKFVKRPTKISHVQ